MRSRSGFGWLQFLIGILLIVLGIWAFTDPDLALTGMVVACGLAAIIMGIADILLFVKVERYTGFGPSLALVSGILSVMSGIMLLAYPGAGVIILTILFPIWFIAHCISRLSHLSSIRLIAGNATFYFALVINIIGLILGFMMLLSPIFTLNTIRYFASAYLILLGIDSVVMAASRIGMRR